MRATSLLVFICYFVLPSVNKDFTYLLTYLLTYSILWGGVNFWENKVGVGLPLISHLLKEQSNKQRKMTKILALRWYQGLF